MCKISAFNSNVQCILELDIQSKFSLSNQTDILGMRKGRGI